MLLERMSYNEFIPTLSSCEVHYFSGAFATILNNCYERSKIETVGRAWSNCRVFNCSSGCGVHVRYAYLIRLKCIQIFGSINV